MPNFKQAIKNVFVEARGSGIHGQGLFAKRRIPAGARVIEYVGEKLSKEESNRRGLERLARSKESGEGSVYIFDLNEECDLDGGFPWNLGRLANHSCEPNCEVQNIDDHIWVIALQDIQKGEEITYDYGYDIEHYDEHPCRCGAISCPGFIVRKDQRGQLRRKLRRMAQAARNIAKPQYSEPS